MTCRRSRTPWPWELIDYKVLSLQRFQIFALTGLLVVVGLTADQIYAWFAGVASFTILFAMTITSWQVSSSFNAGNTFPFLGGGDDRSCLGCPLALIDGRPGNYHWPPIGVRPMKTRPRDDPQSG
jgi:hypothetical protein